MVLEAKYFHGVGTFEVYLLKVSALKLSHPSACPVFKDFSYFSLLRGVGSLRLATEVRGDF
jgi:hypothetical protein